MAKPRETSWWGKHSNPPRKTTTTTTTSTARGHRPAVAIATPVPPPPSAPSDYYYVVAPNGGGPDEIGPMPPLPTPPAAAPEGRIGGGRRGKTTLEDQMYQLERMGDRSTLHKFFLMINIVAGLTAVNNIVAQFVAIQYQGNVPMETVLRVYFIGFCILVVLNEMECTSMLQESRILSNWVSRGIFYTFLGVLANNLYDVGQDNRYRRYNNGYGYNSNASSNGNYYQYGPRFPSSEDLSEWYIWMTSVLLFAIGCVYIILGMLCLQQKLHQLRAQYHLQQQQQQQQQGGTMAAIVC